MVDNYRPSVIPHPPVHNCAVHTGVWTAPARWPGCRSCTQSPRGVLPTAWDAICLPRS